MKLVLTLLVVAVITSGCEGTVIFISTGPSTAVVNAGHADGGTIAAGRPGDASAPDVPFIVTTSIEPRSNSAIQPPRAPSVGCFVT